jgi:hypothetical protein
LLLLTKEEKIRKGQENALIVSQAHQPQRVKDKHQAHQIVRKTNEAEDQVSPLDQASPIVLVSPAQREVVPSSVSKKRSQRLRKFKIKSSKPSRDFKAISQEEKPNLDVTSVPNAIAM